MQPASRRTMFLELIINAICDHFITQRARTHTDKHTQVFTSINCKNQNIVL